MTFLWGHVLGRVQELKNSPHLRDDNAAMDQVLDVLRRAVNNFKASQATRQSATSPPTSVPVTGKSSATGKSPAKIKKKVTIVEPEPAARRKSQVDADPTPAPSNASTAASGRSRRKAARTSQYPIPCTQCRDASADCFVADSGTSCERCANRHSSCSHSVPRKRDGSGPMEEERRAVIRRLLSQSKFIPHSTLQPSLTLGSCCCLGFQCSR